MQQSPYIGADEVHNVLNYGAKGDGAADDRVAIQEALDAADGVKPHTVLIPSGTYKIGTDATENTENPLTYKSNTTIIIQGTLKHYINNTRLSLIEGKNYNGTGARQKNVHVRFDGGYIDFPTRTGTTERKGLVMTYTDYFTVENANTRGDDFGSFNLQVRDCTMGFIQGAIVDGGNDVGEDGLHFTENCSDICVSNLVLHSGDDALSFTQENDAGTIMERIVVNNVVLRTRDHGCLKFLTTASNAVIRDISITNAHFSFQGDNDKGAVLRIQTPETNNGGKIENIRVSGIADGTEGTTNSIVMWVNGDGIDGVDLDVFVRKGRGRVLQIEDAKNVRWNGGGIKDMYVPAPELTSLTVTAIQYVSWATVRVSFNGAPDLSAYPGSNRYLTVSGASNALNNGTFFIKAADNTNKTVDIAVNHTRSAGEDETGLSLSGAFIGQRGLEAIDIRKGSGHAIENLLLDNLAIDGIRIWHGGSGDYAENVTVRNNIFRGCIAGRAIRLYRAKNCSVHGNQIIDSDPLYFVEEDNVSGNTGNFVHNNIDKAGVKDSFHLPKATNWDNYE